MERGLYVHPTADVSPSAGIGEDTKVWHQCQVREGAVIGRNCVLSKGVYIDCGVRIGNNVKIQNGISIYHGVTLEDGVFCGPHCTFTNDKHARAINPDGTTKAEQDWVLQETLVRTGASIGAHATIVCGVTIGRWAVIGAGTVVTTDVPDYGMVYGNPARLHAFACPCGTRLAEAKEKSGAGPGKTSLGCPKCGATVIIPEVDYRRLMDRLEAP